MRTLRISSARLVRPAVTVAVLGALAACGGGGSTGIPEPVNAISTANCTQASLQAAVASLTGDLKTSITSVALSPAGATVNGAAVSSTNPALPEHCVVTGTIDEHTGEPGNTVYGNKIRLRMPTAWNGRFYFMGGGGNNGSVADAVGTFRNMPGHSALARGYAVVAQDSGHNGSSPSFALDQKAYVNFAHQSVHDAKRVSNTLLEKYFGRGPQRSYFVGCSNGGREAMVTAQRYDDFDGVVAGAPALNMFDQWTADVWSLRAVAELAGTAPGVAATSTSQAFSDAQLSFIAKHFTDKCDALDGVADGLVQRFGQCKATTADYQQLQCSTQGGSSSNASCLSPAQTSALAKIYGGPVNSAGVSLATGSNPGGIEANWRGGLLGSGVGGLGSWYQSVIPNLPYMGYGFLGYPGAAANPRAVSSYPTGPVYAAGFNFDRDPALLEPGRLMFHGDNLDTNRAGPNFERFVRRGAKMIIYSGTADASVKAPSVAEFADKLQTSYGQERAESFARTFFVPGMGHCGGGPATDVFDVLTPLVDWVEKGEAPQRIVAQATAGNNLDPNRTGVSRPLCVYPRYARYNGSGDVANAASYSCVAD